MTFNLGIILASVREDRQSEQVAAWLKQLAETQGELKAELLDLKSWNLPHVTTPQPPDAIYPNYTDPLQVKWSQTIAGLDGFMIVTPEYNHSIPGQLKDALDLLYFEWKLKPFALVGISSGAGAGLRAIEHLRQIINTFNAYPMLETLTFGPIKDKFGGREPVDPKTTDRAKRLLDKLVWWMRLLKNNRDSYPK